MYAAEGGGGGGRAAVPPRRGHPYTQGLLGSVPKLGSSLTGDETRLAEIPGLVPSLKQKLEGCVFASRCPHATDLCRKVAPALEAKAPGHVAACHYALREEALAA
jgi:peptide/nickel transport system ATP-binding protein